jgi:hypothetical protein
MKINNSVQEIEFLSGRKAAVASLNSSFEYSLITPTSKKSATKNGIDRQVSTLEVLQQSGLGPVSEVIELGNIDIPRYKRKIFQSNIKGGIQLPRSAAHFSIEVFREETLVGIEYDPASNEILDWHAPTAIVQTQLVEGTTNKIEKSSIFEVSRQEFDIPLYTSYPQDQTSLSVADYSKGMRGLGKRFIQFFTLKSLTRYARKVSEKLLKPIMEKLDRQLSKDNILGFFKLNSKPRKLTDLQEKKLEGKTILLLVHGVISSSSDAFYAVRKDEKFFGNLVAKYDGNILSYDHLTLTKSITTNAMDLAAQLPKGSKIDIICHSRGAGVTRSLLELPAAQAKLDEKRIKFGKVCFVAGACEGSDLASEDALNRLFKIINKMRILLGAGSLGAQPLSIAIKLILGGLQELPGTESMDPEGKYIKGLKKSQSTRASEYHYLRANFDSRKHAIAALDNTIIDKVFFNDKGNDVIVPFHTAGITKTYLNGKVKKVKSLDLGNNKTPQYMVWHITFFSNLEVKKALTKSLSLAAYP